MLCDKCNVNEATVNLVQIENGENIKLHLCLKCSGDFNKTRFSEPNAFKNFLKEILTDRLTDSLSITEVKEITCPNCGMDLQTYKQLEKFGCSNCYNVFENFIDDLIKKTHGSSVHIGNGPACSMEEMDNRKLNILKERLQEFIDKEKFEEAAKIRDEIKIFEKKGYD